MVLSGYCIDEQLFIIASTRLLSNSQTCLKRPLNGWLKSGLLIQVVLWEELTVVINDKWSLDAAGHLSRYDCNNCFFSMCLFVLKKKLFYVIYYLYKCYYYIKKSAHLLIKHFHPSNKHTCIYIHCLLRQDSPDSFDQLIYLSFSVKRLCRTNSLLALSP